MKEVKLSTIIAVTEDDETLARGAAKNQLIKNIGDLRDQGHLKEYVNTYFRTDVIKPEPPTWAEQVDRAARDLIRDNFIPEIVDFFMDEGEVPNDVNNDYANGDGIFHETIVDTDYDAEEAMELLSELSSFEEDDSGLWEGKDWNDILRIKAAYTFGNAVYDEFETLIASINEIDLDELIKQAVKASFKELGHFKMTAEDREYLEIEDLESWLDEKHDEMCRKHLKEILTKEVEECLE
jgi:hypothetical protein